MFLSIQFPVSSVHILFTLRARDHENRNGAFEISINSEIDVYRLLPFLKVKHSLYRPGQSLRIPEV
jgi:hypothetical protein